MAKLGHTNLNICFSVRHAIKRDPGGREKIESDYYQCKVQTKPQYNNIAVENERSADNSLGRACIIAYVLRRQALMRIRPV